MTASRMDKFFALLRQQSIRGTNRINELTRGWLWILADALRETLKPDTAITAAAIAYFALFSLFPIILLSISIASFSLGPSIDRQFIIQRLEFVAPAMSQLFGQNIDEIIEARGPATAVALVGLIWSASTVFYTFTHTLNQICGDKRRRSFWKRRGLAILFVLIFVGPPLFLASFAILDDSQWSDVCTLDLINFLASRHSPTKLLILLCYRPEESSASVRRIEAMREELQYRGLCQELLLG